MTTVVTGWSGRGYDALGKQFVGSFHAFWPVEVGLAVLTDAPDWLGSQRIDMRRPYVPAKLSECSGLAEFRERHEDNRAAHGRRPTPAWKPREVSAAYSFRFDAVKFATQLFIPEAAAKHLPDSEVLVWFDADVVTTAPVPAGWIEGMLGDADVVYLGREGKHSEIGFWAVRLKPETRAFLTGLADMYRSDELFALKEWHSAFVFDHVRKATGLRGVDLTPGGHGHVWPKSPLGKRTAHLKGKRKFTPSLQRRLAA